MTDRYDVAVIGGGPAGAAFAIRMAMRGARVAVIERDDYCGFRIGEHLSPSVRFALDGLGCDLPGLSNCVSPSPGVASHWASEDPDFRPYVTGAGFNVVRNAFDAALLARARRAGADTHAGARGIGFERAASGWRLSFRHAGAGRCIDAGLLIDATGRRAFIARRMGARFERAGRVRAVALLVPHRAPDGERDPALCVEAVESGWLSLTPRPDGSVVTFYSNGRTRAGCSAEPEALVHEAIQASSLVRSRLLAHEWLVGRIQGVWPAFPCLLDTPCGDGWLAIGEAALAYDPISGSGVALALQTAFFAAEMAAAERGSAGAGSLYREALAERYRTHCQRRRDVYREACERFAGAAFWSSGAQ